MKTKKECLKAILNADDSKVSIKKENRGYGIYVNGWFITSAYHMPELFEKVCTIVNAVIASEIEPHK